MKLSEAFEKIDKSPDNEDDIGESFMTELGFDEWDLYDVQDYLQPRLKIYWFSRWLCTDTWVGGRLIFWDGKPLGVLSQFARKSSERYEFIEGSQETLAEIKQFIREKLPIPDRHIEYVSFDEEIGDNFHVNYTDEIRSSVAIWNGTPYAINREATRAIGRSNIIAKEVVLITPSGDVTVSLSEVTFPFHLASTNE